ncbi:MAG: SDR family NAD(P)-dependent oxidoreductase [Gammaproteobacteria bacterium]|nr:SDR family NAD(P)-dependent oxidoreductase [Gammaproteobacteria bacterium]
MAFSKFDLTGKVALVTGGNSGIGLGFAEGLAEAGADVCIWGTNETKNEAAAEKLKQYGGKVLAQRCDVGDQEQVTESFARAVEEFGHIDSCFANAGIGGKGTLFADVTAEEWHEVFRVNMDGVFYTLQTAVKHMVEKGDGGSLVVTSSGTAIFGSPRSVHYGATKAGINAMIRSLCTGYARYGIRANAIIPGWIDTPMTAGSLNSDLMKAKVLTRIPQRRWGVPSDFSGLAVYLASDASVYHSGDVMMIDGGFAAF